MGDPILQSVDNPFGVGTLQGDPGPSPMGHLHVGNTPDGDAIVQHAETGAPLVVSQQAREAAKVPDRSSFLDKLGRGLIGNLWDKSGLASDPNAPPSPLWKGPDDGGAQVGPGPVGDAMRAATQPSPSTPQPTVTVPPSAQPTNGQPPPQGPPPKPGSGGGVPAKPDQGEQDLNAASDQADNAIKEGRQADIQKAQAEQAGQQAVADYNTDTAAALKKQRATQGQAEAVELQKLGQMQQNLSKQAALDPARWWNSRDTFQKASAGLGMILENFAAAIGHRPVRDFVKENSDQDIDAQKASFENAKSAFEAAQSNYGQLRQKGLSDQQATLLLRNAGLDAITAHAKSMAAASGVPQAIANADKLAAMNHLDKVKNIQTYHQAQLQQATAAESLKQQKIQTGVMQQQQAQAGNPDRPLREGEVAAGGRIYNVGKEKANELQAQTTAADSFRAAVAKAKAALDKGGTSSSLAESNGEYRAALAEIYKLQNASEGIKAVVGESERQMLDHLLEPGFFKNNGSIKAALDTLDEGVKHNVNSAYKQVRLPGYYADTPPTAQKAAP